MRSLLLVLALLASTAAAPVSAASIDNVCLPIPGPTITDLGAGVYPRGIDAGSHVVGTMAVGSYYHAFVSQNGTLKDLGTVGGLDSYAYASNSAGQIIGYSETSSHERGIMWWPPLLTTLDPLPGDILSEAFAINTSGAAVGYSESSGLVQHAVIWQRGQPTYLGTLFEAQVSRANAINDANQVVGTSGPHAFIWQNGIMTDLGTLQDGASSQALGINRNGIVVGHSTIAGDSGHIHAAMWQNGAPTALASLSGQIKSSATAINAFGQIVGASYVGAPSDPPQLLIPHAVTWQNGAIRDLTAMLPCGSGWTLTSALSINDAGQIVGTGTFAGLDHGYIFTPRTLVTTQGGTTTTGGGGSTTAP